MVSQANLQTFSKAGGKYLLEMPMRRGDEVTEDVLPRPGRYRTVAENLAATALLPAQWPPCRDRDQWLSLDLLRESAIMEVFP